MQREQACTLAVEIENLERSEKETAAGAALNIRGPVLLRHAYVI